MNQHIRNIVHLLGNYHFRLISSIKDVARTLRFTIKANKHSGTLRLAIKANMDKYGYGLEGPVIDCSNLSPFLSYISSVLSSLINARLLPLMDIVL